MHVIGLKADEGYRWELAAIIASVEIVGVAVIALLARVDDAVAAQIDEGVRLRWCGIEIRGVAIWSGGRVRCRGAGIGGRRAGIR